METSRFGRSKFGGGQAMLLALSILGGSGLAALFALLMFAIQQPERVGIFFGIYLAATLPIMTALVWVMLVDRSTVAGAIAHPELSIENNWFDKASSDTYIVASVLTAIGCFALSGWHVQVSPSNACLAAAVLLQLVFLACYLLRKYRGQ